MPRLILTLIAALVLWIPWCILVIEEIVPHLRRHITIWPWFMAYTLCLLPVVLAALMIVIRLNRRPS
jgi:hypothetical protein